MDIVFSFPSGQQDKSSEKKLEARWYVKKIESAIDSVNVDIISVL